MSDQENKPEDNNNNFFNKNPLITFALFSVIIIMIFKMFVGESGQGFNAVGNNQPTQHKDISYSDFKKSIEQGQIQSSYWTKFYQGYGNTGWNKLRIHCS